MRADIPLVVERLRQAATTGRPCAPVRDLLGETDVDMAYVVQSRVAESRTQAGHRVVGRKIGLTSTAVQRQFGVAEPDFGLLFADTVHASGAPVPLADFLQPRVEAEIAFVLGRTLDNPDSSVADVLRATEFVLAAIEIVDSRIAGWDIHITDTVADNASAGAVVLGTTPYSLMGLDLAQVSMVLERDGETVSSGSGADCMGSPVKAVAWLAREVARRGQPLQQGEIVLSGSLGPVIPVEGPCTFRARLDGIGSVDAVFVTGGAR